MTKTEREVSTLRTNPAWSNNHHNYWYKTEEIIKTGQPFKNMSSGPKWNNQMAFNPIILILSCYNFNCLFVETMCVREFRK